MVSPQEWIRLHFKELVDEYAGKYVAVSSNGVISTGTSSKKVEKDAQKKYPKKKISVLLVPKKEDLNCLL